jgi:Predicted nucleic acid-binding protein, contains PIN domain
MTLTDTSILINFLKGKIKYLGDSISIISLMEVGRVIENKRRLEVFKTLEDMFKVYPIDEKVAVEYTELDYSLREKGRLIADLDLIIASTAMAHN